MIADRFVQIMLEQPFLFAEATVTVLFVLFSLSLLVVAIIATVSKCERSYRESKGIHTVWEKEYHE